MARQELLTTQQVATRIIIIISVIELLIMQAFSLLPFRLSTNFEALLDASLLATFSTPLVYLWVIRPFVMARDKALAEADHMAYHDPLTNLANRRMFVDLLERELSYCARHQVYSVLLLIDLDGFKQINDAHGHEAGDAVLVEVANRLKRTVRLEDSVCRLGGDEFVILFSRLSTEYSDTKDMVLTLANKLQALLKEPIHYRNLLLEIGASIGIRILDSKETGVEAALREADMAMYYSKKHGRSGVTIFHESQVEEHSTQ